MFATAHKGPAVLTSDVINEAQALFQMKSLKKEGCEPLCSQNDLLFILRGIGMNPTQEDVDEIVGYMSPYDPDERRDDKKKKKEKKNDEEEKKKKKAEEDEGKASLQLPEDVPKYAWLSLIEAVEMGYRNARRCEDEIISCMKVFENGARMPLKELVSIMSTLGDDVLTPAETDELLKLFGNPENPRDMEGIDVEYEVFAKTVQEGQRPPPPPPPADGDPANGTVGSAGLNGTLGSQGDATGGTGSAPGTAEGKRPSVPPT